MTTRMIIFDFDGTVADTIAAGAEIYNHIAEKAGYIKIDDSNREHLRELDARAVFKELNIPLIHIPVLALRIHTGLALRVKDTALFDGMRELLDSLREKYTLALLTSNSFTNVEAFFAAHTLPDLSHVYAGVSIFGKEKRIKALLKEARIAPHEALYVGDEVRDIVAAKKAGIPVIAVSWGANTRTALERAEPTFIADTPHMIYEYLASN